MKTLILATALIGIAAAAAPASAQVNARQNEQQRRIYNGVRSGELTHHEANRLEHREGRIAAAEARDRRSGGGLSPAERRRLAYRQDRASAAIYRQKHDAQVR